MPRRKEIAFTLPVHNDEQGCVSGTTMRQRVWSLLKHQSFKFDASEVQDEIVASVATQICHTVDSIYACFENVDAGDPEWDRIPAAILHYFLEFFACIHHGTFADRPAHLSGLTPPKPTDNLETTRIIERILGELLHVKHDTWPIWAIIPMYESAHASSGVDFRTDFVKDFIDKNAACSPRDAVVCRFYCREILAKPGKLKARDVLDHACHQFYWPYFPSEQGVIFLDLVDYIPTTMYENEGFLTALLSTPPDQDKSSQGVLELFRALGVSGTSAMMRVCFQPQYDTENERTNARRHMVREKLWELFDEDSRDMFLKGLALMCDPRCESFYVDNGLLGVKRNPNIRETFDVDEFTSLATSAYEDGFRVNEFDFAKFCADTLDEDADHGLAIAFVNKTFGCMDTNTKRALEHIESLEHEALTPAKRRKLNDLLLELIQNE